MGYAATAAHSAPALLPAAIALLAAQWPRAAHLRYSLKLLLYLGNAGIETIADEH